MATSSEKPKKQIFILSGQSNMSGRGGVRNRKWDGEVPQECQPHPSVFRFSSSSLWEPASPPLHADIDYSKTCGVGPGLPFARSLLPHLSSSAAIGLVPCAIGGTEIDLWGKGQPLYEDMVRRAKEAVAAGGGEIGAVLWFQGESDTLSAEAAEGYKGKMEKLIEDLRSDLGLPSLPFIQVAIASGSEPWIDKVREAQFAIDMPNVVCVDAKGLPLNEDRLHLSTQAQVLLGNMLAEAYINNFLNPPSK
ncbi:putative carbohydrate esterase [Iris pallida]|uniref:Carbohydrate esterase n=1 Tax=Iris pallida TaxID=29817 RepID=A0AAX6DWU2_IRIPA|nr:putative carbohydrate esterase [Iris pallida]KAJ6807995.1 putative carbohydrate esterase [Iris pallida]